MQVATPDWIALIDPLVDGRPDQPIWDAVADPSITTVVHAHDQESRFCYERTGSAPQNLFDVQLAGRVPALLVPFRLSRFENFDLVGEKGAASVGH